MILNLLVSRDASEEVETVGLWLFKSMAFMKWAINIQWRKDGVENRFKARLKERGKSVILW